MNKIFQTIIDQMINDHLKISKIAKFGGEMLSNTENIALQIYYKFILRAGLDRLHYGQNFEKS